MKTFQTYKIICITCLLVFGGLRTKVYSQSATLNNSAKSPIQERKFVAHPFENKVFIEEQGQFKKDLQRKKINLSGTILYAVNNPEFNAYFTTTGITFLFTKTEKKDPEKEKKERGEKEEEDDEVDLTEREVVSMQWVNANPLMQITAREKANNYYTYGRYADNSQYDHVDAYKKLYFTNIYDGVDAEFILPETGGIKYQFIVRAGYSIPTISYRIKGAKNIYLDNKGDLHVEAALDTLIDKAPKAFLKNAEIPFHYNLSGNLIELIPDQNLNLLQEDLIIDPWLINPGLPVTNNGYDVQEDSLGNVYVFGGTPSNHQVQKYTPTGVLQWTSTTTSYSYYGDFAVANSGSVYLCDGCCGSGVAKLNSSGAVTFTTAVSGELWRLDFNKSKTILSVGGYFNSNINLGKIDTATGAVSNELGYSVETRSIATDCNGDIYSLHVTFGYAGDPGTNVLRKTNADFSPGGSVLSGFSLYESGPLYVPTDFGGINGITVNGPNIYIYDGAELRRFNKSTLTFVNSVTVPNGAFFSCSGLAFDFCGNIYAGTMSTIEKYDASLNHISSIPVNHNVYDVILAHNGDILASGKDFVANIGPTCSSPPPLAVSDTSTNASCSLPGTATLSATGGSLPYAYIWQPGSQTTAAITGLTAGTYSYTVNDAFCQSHSDSIVILQSPALMDTCILIKKPSCNGFSNGSAFVSVSGGSPPFTYSWNTSPVQLNDTASGLSAGSYTATVTDASGCVKAAAITIGQPLVLSATTSSTITSCFAGSDGTATALPAGGTTPYTYSWNSTPGQTAATANNLAAGTYTCTVTDSNSCTTTAIATVTEPPVVYIDPVITDTICAGQNAILSAVAHGGNSGGYSYTWNSPVSVGPNNTVSPVITATYSVIATDSKSCLSAQQTVTVKVNPLPTASVSGTIAVCKNANAPTVTFTGAVGTPPFTFTYKINSGSNQTVNTISGNSVTVSAPTGIAGTYTYSLVSVTDASSTTCTQTQSGSAVITIHDNPIAIFSNTSKCNGNNTQFTDNSTTASGTINAWVWNFGDGSALNINQNPPHLYANAGSYTASLIVNSSVGCADTVSKSVQVFYNPIAGFTHNDVCFKDSMLFSNTSSVHSSAAIASYLWVFGDGSPTSNLQNPVHFYSTPGPFNVTLLTTTTDGCSDVINNSVNVFDPPSSAFVFNNTCLFAPAAFTNTSLNPTMGTIASWSWNFGDGTPLNTTVNNPNHLYSIPGNYQVTLITHSTNLGCADTLKDSITVFPMPIADFGFADVCFSEIMNFYDSSEVASGNISGWSWNFGDGSLLVTSQDPTHTYANPGSYNVTLISATNNGCKDTITKSVVIHPLPIASYTTANVCLGSTSAFNNQSTISTNPTNDVIQSWIWNFGDGSPVITITNSTHLYTAIGAYSAKLLVISNFGCKDSISKPYFVNPNPSPDFTADDTVGCEPLCVNFQNLSTIATGTNTGHSWNFGNGSSTNQNPNHCYNNDSIYTTITFNIILQVTSDSGCTTTLTKNNYITVHPNPEAGFSVQPATVSILNPIISIIDLSAGANFWTWNYGDLDTSSFSSPLPHTYADTGTYTITQIVSTLNNCIDTSYQTVTIEPEFLFYIPSAFTPNNDGKNDVFTGKGVFIVTFEMMIFDRWGNLVFFSDDINKPWDGTVNYGSEIAQQDVYVYTIKITDIKRKKHSYNGIITLVR
ncbi:MAG: PKD domain-containing protein [Bacteroidota bacterium]